jgi:hypothetical protein
MEETLNGILSELKHLSKDQQELMTEQKELIGRIENLEKNQKKLITSGTKNTNKIYEELITGQRHLKFRLDNLEKIKDLVSLGQNEICDIKELIKQTTTYLSNRMSISDRMIFEIELLSENEQQEILNKINEKIYPRKNTTWRDIPGDDMYDDY